MNPVQSVERAVLHIVQFPIIVIPIIVQLGFQLPKELMDNNNGRYLLAIIPHHRKWGEGRVYPIWRQGHYKKEKKPNSIESVLYTLNISSSTIRAYHTRMWGIFFDNLAKAIQSSLFVNVLKGAGPYSRNNNIIWACKTVSIHLVPKLYV